MSFATDLDFHYREIARTAGIQGRVRFSVEREAVRTKKAFFEFFDETKRPSPTGVLETPMEYWLIIIPLGDRHRYVGIDLECLRLLCYPKFLKYKEWGGDHQAFVGVTIDLTRLASFHLEPIAPSERHEIARLRAEILRQGCPHRPAAQDCLWPDNALNPGESHD